MDFGSFLNDVRKNLTSIFGGSNNQKKKKDEPRQMPTVQRQNNPLLQQQQQQGPGSLMMPKLTIPIAGQKPDAGPLQLGGVTPNDTARLEREKIIESIRKTGKVPQQNGMMKPTLASDQREQAVKAGIKARDEDVNGTGLERRVDAARKVNAGLDFLTIAQGTAMIPETMARSAAEVFTGKDQSLDTRKLRSNDPRRVLYGRDGVNTYQRMGNEAEKFADEQASKSSLTRNVDTSAVAPVVGLGLAGLDAIPGGKQVKTVGKGLLKGGKGALDEFLNVTDDAITNIQRKRYERSTEPDKAWVNSQSRREAQAAHEAGKTNSPITPAVAVPKPDAITSANPNFVPAPKPGAVPPEVPRIMADGRPAGVPQQLGEMPVVAQPPLAGVLPEPAPIKLGPTPFDPPAPKVVDPFVAEEAARYSDPSKFIDEMTADMYEASRGGNGSIIARADDLGRDGVRLSDNSPFYQAAKEQNGGRVPNKAEVRKMVEDYMGGKDNAVGYELPPEVRDIYSNITPQNKRQLASYITDKPVPEYKVGDKVSTGTSQGGSVNGTIVKVPDLSKDLRIKGNDFAVKLEDGSTRKVASPDFEAPEVKPVVMAAPKPKPKAKPPVAPTPKPTATLSYTSPIKNSNTASVPGTSSVRYNTGDAQLDTIVHDSIIAVKGTAETASKRVEALTAAGVDAVKQRKVRNIATKNVDKTTGRISDEGQAKIRAVLDGTDAPKKPAKAVDGGAEKPPADATPPVADAPAEKLGTITRKSILDDSINTPEGVDEVVRKVTSAAESEAEAAGTTLDDIIRKGQKVWKKSSTSGKDLTTQEASIHVKGFTPEQQAIYKAHAQEIGTLRERSGFSLDGGNQGAWYGPRQSLDEAGNSAEFNPKMVNEIKRVKNQADDGIEDVDLDTSGVPYEQAIRRYANAPDAGSQKLIDAIENKVVKNKETGVEEVVERGIKVPERAKEKLTQQLTDMTKKRDQALKMQEAGDLKGSRKLAKEVQDDINKAFNDLADDIPGTRKDRKAAVSELMDMRGAYMQSTMQTLSLSNVVNRAADQGTRLVYGAQRPLGRGLDRVISPLMAKKVMKGTDVNKLNTSRNAGKAADEFAKGTLMREVRDNFKTNMSLAGAGRGIIGKGIAKLDALPRALSSGFTQVGDLSTQNVKKALQLGASRAEAKGLKTVEEYRTYFADYVNTDGFKQDLAKADGMNNARIGLAGAKGDNMASGGQFSNGVSRYVDNGIRTGAEALGAKPGNRAVTEVNDFVKGNITGYAAVGARVFGTVANAGALGIPRVLKAIKVAKSGDPTAVASATQIASQSVNDAIALYGTAGAATAVIAASNGAIGFTGSRAKEGSSESAYNKANNVPSNQWYFKSGGNRVYFDPSRPLGGPGVAANIAGSAATGKNPGATALESGSQIFNQAGGSSIPKTIVNAQTAADTASSGQDFAWKQTQAVLAPSTGLLNNFANWGDNKKRAPDDFISNIKSNVPGLRGQVAEAKDSRGNTIANSKQISGGSGLFSVAKDPNATVKVAADKSKPSATVDDEVNRLQTKYKDVFPTKSNTNATDKRTQKNSDLLLKSKVYQGLDDRGKANYLKETLTGSKTKDISDKLSDEDRTAMIEYKLQSKDKAEKWRDDNNDNASAFYTADYNNDKARSVLTTKDDNLEEKDGKRYKMIRAQVNQKYGVDRDTQLMYENTSVEEWRAMLDEDSDVFDLKKAQKLLDYDSVRTGSGVSGKSSTSSKNKFTKKAPKKGSGRGRGGGGGGNFGFAQLPSSLIGADSASKYADDAPLFQPIPDLRVPQAQIPRGRSISVKKGISL